MDSTNIWSLDKPNLTKTRCVQFAVAQTLSSILYMLDYMIPTSIYDHYKQSISSDVYFEAQGSDRVNCQVNGDLAG